MQISLLLIGYFQILYCAEITILLQSSIIWICKNGRSSLSMLPCKRWLKCMMRLVWHFFFVQNDALVHIKRRANSSVYQVLCTVSTQCSFIFNKCFTMVRVVDVDLESVPGTLCGMHTGWHHRAPCARTHVHTIIYKGQFCFGMQKETIDHEIIVRV